MWKRVYPKLWRIRSWKLTKNGVNYTVKLSNIQINWNKRCFHRHPSGQNGRRRKIIKFRLGSQTMICLYADLVLRLTRVPNKYLKLSRLLRLKVSGTLTLWRERLFMISAKTSNFSTTRAKKLLWWALEINT